MRGGLQEEGIFMDEAKVGRKNRKLMRRFIPYYKPYVPTLATDLMCAMLTTVCDLVLPLIIRKITNTAIDDVRLLTPRLILSMGATYAFLRIVVSFAQYYMNSIGHVMGTKMETDMRRDLFSHLQRLQFSYYDETKVGQIMARITSDLFEVTEFAHHCPEEFFMAGVKIAVSFVILGKINIYLTLMIFLVVPLMILAHRFFRTKMNRSFKVTRHQVGEINAQVEDSLLGVRVVKSFANEDVEEEKFRKGNEKFLSLKKISYHYMGAFNACVNALDGLMYVIVVIAGSFFLIKGRINVGDFSAYLLYVSALLTSIRTIVQFTEQFEKGMTGFERFTEIVDTPVTIVNRKNAKPLSKVRGAIAFKDVSFSYGEGQENILHNINLTVRPGENIALVGPSGAGKTTLCNLIPRFYDVTGGSVEIDGHDVRDFTLQSLRDNVGVVQQDVYLFSGTVADNIRYGKLDATDEEIVEAAKLAGADEFICQLPGGYQSPVGERGVKLSGGQKQRISIARVFLKNPPILILDEATSALDNESEMIVRKSLEKLAKGRTTFTIAHRLTTIKNADTILVLTENGIEERGSHLELIEKQGIYSRLYEMYSR